MLKKTIVVVSLIFLNLTSLCQGESGLEIKLLKMLEADTKAKYSRVTEFLNKRDENLMALAFAVKHESQFKKARKEFSPRFIWVSDGSIQSQNKQEQIAYDGFLAENTLNKICQNPYKYEAEMEYFISQQPFWLNQLKKIVADQSKSVLLPSSGMPFSEKLIMLIPAACLYLFQGVLIYKTFFDSD